MRTARSRGSPRRFDKELTCIKSFVSRCGCSYVGEHVLGHPHAQRSGQIARKAASVAGAAGIILRSAQGTDEDYKDAEVPMRLTEDEIVASLPPWTTQITLRACGVGVVLGVLFQFVTMRFALGPGGVVPTFNMPMGAQAG